MSLRTGTGAGLEFRRAAGLFPTGVTVLSTLVDGEPHGMTVNTFASVSLDPLLVLVSLSTSSRTLARVQRSGAFVVTVLGADQRQVARWFADPARPSGAAGFAGVPRRPAPHSGAPVLAEGVAYFDCEVDRAHAAGDHTVVIGAVRTFDVLSDRPPLLFVRSRFAHLPTAEPAPRSAPRRAVPRSAAERHEP